MGGRRVSERITREQVESALGRVAIPRRWHPEPIKRRGNTRWYIEVQELEEIVSAVLYQVREELTGEFLGLKYENGYEVVQ